MRVKVTTEVDESLVLQFKVCREPDKPTFAAILTKGMIEYLKSKDPVKGLDIEIDMDRKRLDEKLELRARMRVLEPDQKRMVEYEEKQGDQFKLTEEWFSKDPESKINAISKQAMNWKRVAEKIGASSPHQAQEWVMKVVSQWKEKHE